MPITTDAANTGARGLSQPTHQADDVRGSGWGTPVSRGLRVVRGRPRQHDLDSLLDHASALWVEKGAAGLTMRALSDRSGAGNGAIYNAFGSRANLLARVWVREADAFLDFQRTLVDESLATASPADAVITAALALARYAETHEEASRLLLAAEVKDLINSELGPRERSNVDRLRTVLGQLILDLAENLWNRTDRDAVLLIRLCLVELPGRLLLSSNRVTDRLSQHALAHAVRGITSAEPPLTTT